MGPAFAAVLSDAEMAFGEKRYEKSIDLFTEVNERTHLPSPPDIILLSICARSNHLI